MSLLSQSGVTLIMCLLCKHTQHVDGKIWKLRLHKSCFVLTMCRDFHIYCRFFFFCRCLQLVLFATNFQRSILNFFAVIGVIDCEVPLDVTASVSRMSPHFNTKIVLSFFPFPYISVTSPINLI